jgi:hypothetical protein
MPCAVAKSVRASGVDLLPLHNVISRDRVELPGDQRQGVGLLAQDLFAVEGRTDEECVREGVLQAGFGGLAGCCASRQAQRDGQHRGCGKTA